MTKYFFVMINVVDLDGFILRYSFVHFKSADECKKGHDSAQGKIIRGSPIMVNYAKKSAKKQQKKTTRGLL